MDDKNVVVENLDKLHTTDMGADRIQRNLNMKSTDVVAYCKQNIMKKNCMMYRRGKNWYCEIDNLIITVNASSYTIITAHIKDKM